MTTIAMASDTASTITGVLGEAWPEHSHEELYARVKEIVFPIGLRYGHDRTAADDLVQNVFLKVYLRMESFRGESILKSWIYRIAINEAHDNRRWYHRQIGREVGAGSGRNQEAYWQRALADSSPSPFERAAWAEFQSVIFAALAKLDARDR